MQVEADLQSPNTPEASAFLGHFGRPCPCTCVGADKGSLSLRARQGRPDSSACNSNGPLPCLAAQHCRRCIHVDVDAVSNLCFGVQIVRITVTIDDELFEKALEMADPNMGRAEIFREAFKSFIQVQAAKRLIALGGSARDIKPVRRRREEPSR